MLEKILETAKNRGLTQNELERVSGLAKGRISKWKGGQGEPGWDDVLKVAGYLNLPLTYLADDSATKSTAPEPIPEEVRLLNSIITRLGPEESLKRLLNEPGAAKPTTTVEILGEKYTGPETKPKRASAG